MSPIQVVARPKVWICDRSLIGIAGSNPAAGMDVLLLCLCIVRGSYVRLISRPEESYLIWRV